MSSPPQESSSPRSSSDHPPPTLSKAVLANTKRLGSVRVGGRFKLARRLGGGAFGDVYYATDMNNNDQVAVKLEPTHSIHQPHLQHEARLYHYLHKHCPIVVGVPKMRWYGREGDFNVLVMDLLGPSLEDLFEFCGRSFDMKTVMMLADQMISRLEFLHAMNYLHRDLKPENFVMGLGKKAHHVYIIDMGLAKKFRDSKTGAHIPYIDGKSLTGTARYVSINTHLGIQQSRRDDMEALAIVLIYFARGGLPWQGVKCPTKQAKYERIKMLKMQISSQTLCEKLPNAFLVFLMYTRSLGFEESPDYTRCRKLFSDAMDEHNMDMDYDFAWLKLSTKNRETNKDQPAVVYPKSSTTGATARWGGTTAMSVSGHTDQDQASMTGSQAFHSPNGRYTRLASFDEIALSQRAGDGLDDDNRPEESPQVGGLRNESGST